MSKSLLRKYWDSNAWIAYIRQEMPFEENGIKLPRYEMCRKVLKRAEGSAIEIVTSAFTLSEVCKRRDEPLNPSLNVPAFFDQPYVFLIEVTKAIGSKAQHLQLSGVTGLKPADAIHIASALIANVPVFHTFDGKLLNLDKVLTCDDGNQLRIVPPGREDPAPGFLKQLEE